MIHTSVSDTSIGALTCALRGWAVLPLHTIRGGGCSCMYHQGCKPGKHPIGRLVPHGLKDATTDPSIITDWWRQMSDANVGIATGAVSGLVVLDVDPAHGGDETLRELEITHGGLPHTVEVVTGSGGRHVYFRHPGVTVRNSAGTALGDGLDIRGDGGYVVAPPSAHLSGHPYEWESTAHPDDTPLADLPPWLLALVATPASNGHQPGTPIPPSGLPLSKDALDFVANGAPVGQQRERALKAGRSYLGAGYSAQDAARAIWRGLQFSPCGEPAIPWTEQAATKIINDLMNKPAPAPHPLRNPRAQQVTIPDLPIIYASWLDLKRITDACWDAILLANDPPRYFRHGGLPSRIEGDDQGAPVVREMTVERLRHEMSRIAEWKARKLLKDGTWAETEARPQVDVMKDILATPDAPLPVLTRIVEVPVFAADGTLQTAPGYHAAARTYYAPAEGVAIPEIPTSPTEADVVQARTLILDMLSDFPFVANADLAHSIALLLLPFVRDMIQGPTPNHLIEAPTAGCGKGLLANALLSPAVGCHVGVTICPKDEEEFRKRLTAQLKEGRAAVLLDNVTTLDSSAFAGALTATTWDDRVLGKTETLSLAVRCVWMTTANNPTLSTEIARRSVRIRLDPMQDRPWQREGFRHGNLRGWFGTHRGELAGAALTLIQSWLAAGRPETSTKPLGSYERWTVVIGGILQHVGIPGFLANSDEFYEATDLEGAIWRQFIAIWWEKFHENEVDNSNLFPLAQASYLFDLGKGGDRSQRTMFGGMLVKQRDRVIGNYRIVQTRVSHQAKKWRLLPNMKRGNLGNIGEVSLLSPMCENIFSTCTAPPDVPLGSQGSPLSGLDTHEQPIITAAPIKKIVDRSKMQEALDANKSWGEAVDMATIYPETEYLNPDEYGEEVN